MHEQWEDIIDDALNTMPDPEKAQLIERIASTINYGLNPSAALSPEEVAARIAEISSLPLQSAPDGFSGRDHDSVLYGARKVT